MFTETELAIIKSVLALEAATGREQPTTNFYKAIALDAAKRLGLTWAEVKEII